MQLVRKMLVFRGPSLIRGRFIQIASGYSYDMEARISASYLRQRQTRRRSMSVQDKPKRRNPRSSTNRCRFNKQQRAWAALMCSTPFDDEEVGPSSRDHRTRTSSSTSVGEYRAARGSSLSLSRRPRGMMLSPTSPSSASTMRARTSLRFSNGGRLMRHSSGSLSSPTRKSAPAGTLDGKQLLQTQIDMAQKRVAELKRQLESTTGSGNISAVDGATATTENDDFRKSNGERFPNRDVGVKSVPRLRSPNLDDSREERRELEAQIAAALSQVVIEDDGEQSVASQQQSNNSPQSALPGESLVRTEEPTHCLKLRLPAVPPRLRNLRARTDAEVVSDVSGMPVDSPRSSQGDTGTSINVLDPTVETVENLSDPSQQQIAANAFSRPRQKSKAQQKAKARRSSMRAHSDESSPTHEESVRAFREAESSKRLSRFRETRRSYRISMTGHRVFDPVPNAEDMGIIRTDSPPPDDQDGGEQNFAEAVTQSLVPEPTQPASRKPRVLGIRDKSKRKLGKSRMAFSESDDVTFFDSTVDILAEQRWTKGRNRGRATKRYLAIFVIAILTGIVAASITALSRWLTALKLESVGATLIQMETNGTAFDGAAFLSQIGFNLVCVFGATCVVAFGETVAAGSGIPEIKCILNGVTIRHATRFKTLIFKVVGVILSVAGGLPVGKEGPMIHSGSIVGSAVSQGKTSYHALRCRVKTCRIFDFRNDREKKNFIVCGAAAGVAAAFGAPLGGVMFCLEEGASWWHPKITWRTFFAAVVSSFFTTLVLSGFGPGDVWDWSYFGTNVSSGVFTVRGRNLDLQDQNGTWWSIVIDDLVQDFDYYEIPLFILLGAAGGVIGALFNYCNGTIIAGFRQRWVQKQKWSRIVEALCVSVLCSVMTFGLPKWIGSCTKTPPPSLQVAGTKFVALYCPQEPFDAKGNPFEYNQLATLLFSSSENAIKQLFYFKNDPTDESFEDFDFSVLAIFGTVYTALTCIVFGLSVPSGVFIPALLSGAAFGRLFGQSLDLANTGGELHLNAGMYATLGAAAMLGGVTRMVISLTVILVEATGNIQITLPVMVVLVTARFVGNRFNEGLYDMYIERMGVPFLEWSPPIWFHSLNARHVMTPRPVCLRSVERAGFILKVLKESTCNAFPVVLTHHRDGDSLDDDDDFGSDGEPRRRRGLIHENILSGVFSSDSIEANGDAAVTSSPVGGGESRHDQSAPANTFSTNPPQQSDSPPVDAYGSLSRQASMFNTKIVEAVENAAIAAGNDAAEAARHRRSSGADNWSDDGLSPEEARQKAVEAEKQRLYFDLRKWSFQQLNGIILRKHLLCLLCDAFKARTLQKSMPEPSLASDHMKFAAAIDDRVLTHYEFERNYPRYPRLDKIRLTDEEKDMWVDLSPYAGLPFAVPSVCSLSRTFQLFRTMGLRHIVVTDSEFCVTGIITRKELTVEHCKEKYKKLGLDAFVSDKSKKCSC
eukprot:INCI16404.4.p1 GENE.INCI16404.4~~INCI16404.4.p1  ORF type:complete len:1459 (-),score=252.58 INCI16404.4:108-4484(-)